MIGNIQAAIFKYKKYRQSNPDTCMLHCKNQPTLSDAIYYACVSEDARGKRHSHQRRLKKEDMELFANHLQSLEQQLQNADNFDSIFKIINNVGSKINGIGDMLIYDAAERIGAYLSIYPDKVYLHAGTKEGAEKIIGKTEKATIKKGRIP